MKPSMPRHFTTGLAAGIFSLLLPFAVTAAVDSDTFQKQYEEDLARIEVEVGKAGEATMVQYRTELARLETSAQKAGDLDGVLAVREEKKRLETDPAPPDADSLKHESLKTLAGKLEKELGKNRAAAEGRRLQLANRLAAQLKDFRNRASRLGDRDAADKADQALRKLMAENKDIPEDAASPVPSESPAKPAAMPVYAKAFPRLSASLVAYTGFDGLPDSVSFAGETEILGIEGVKAVPAGFKGMGAAFSGHDSRLVASFPAAMANATEASLCIWFKSNGVKGTLVCLYAGEDAGITMYIDDEGRLEGHSGHTSNGVVTSSRPVNDGQWHFGVLSCGAGRVTLYVDGAKVNSVASKGKVSDPNSRLVIGATENHNIFKPTESYFDWTFRGELDEFLLFTRALNENEARSLGMMMRSAKP